MTFVNYADLETLLGQASKRAEELCSEVERLEGLVAAYEKDIEELRGELGAARARVIEAAARAADDASFAGALRSADRLGGQKAVDDLVDEGPEP